MHFLHIYDNFKSGSRENSQPLRQAMLNLHEHNPALLAQILHLFSGAAQAGSDPVTIESVLQRLQNTRELPNLSDIANSLLQLAPAPPFEEEEGPVVEEVE
jgi:hypothetical protein